MKQPWTYIDEPTPFDTLATWESYRKGLDVVEDAEYRDLLIKEADEVIADLKAGRKPYSDKAE